MSDQAEQHADYVLIGYLCQDHPGADDNGPSRKHYGTGGWSRNRIFKEPRCPDCWPVYRRRTGDDA